MVKKKVNISAVECSSRWGWISLYSRPRRP